MKRRNLPLSTLDHDGSAIAAVLSLWRAARPAKGRLPSRDSFDVERFAALLDGTGWVTVVTERPARFRFHAVPVPAPIVLRDLAAVGRHGAALREAARQVHDDYSAVAFTGVPILHRLQPGDGAADDMLERLILPFAEDGVGVDGLLVCAQRRAPVVLH